jgi:HK97 family phage portal protein
MSRTTDILRSWLGGRANQKGAILPAAPGFIRHSYLKPTFAALVREGTQKNAAVLACVSALTFAFPEPPFQVYEDETDESPVIAKHPLRALLTKPNTLMGEAELMAITMAYLAIGGNAYWHKVRNRRGQVVEVWPYHAGNFFAVPGGPNWIERYDFNDGAGKLIPVDPADVVHFKWPVIDPTQPWQAQAPLMAAAGEVDTDSEATAYLYALLKNDAVPRTVLTVPADRFLQEDEVRRMREQWRERYGGSKKGEVAIVEGGTKVERLGLDMAQLAFEALHRIPETRIAAVLRVPAIVAGLNSGLERSTYANYGQARKAMTQDTLVPLWRIVGSELGADLLPEVGGPLGDVRADLKRVQALQEDSDKRWGRVTGAWRDDLLTKNESRRALGYAERAGGDLTRSELAAQQSAQTGGV